MYYIFVTAFAMRASFIFGGVAFYRIDFTLATVVFYPDVFELQKALLLYHHQSNLVSCPCRCQSECKN